MSFITDPTQMDRCRAASSAETVPLGLFSGSYGGMRSLSRNARTRSSVQVCPSLDLQRARLSERRDQCARLRLQPGEGALARPRPFWARSPSRQRDCVAPDVGAPRMGCPDPEDGFRGSDTPLARSSAASSTTLVSAGSSSTRSASSPSTLETQICCSRLSPAATKEERRPDHQSRLSRLAHDFPNATCATALIDRVVHHADVIAIEGESYRAREADAQAKARRTRKKAPADPMPADPNDSD
jgi:hypothetical protein